MKELIDLKLILIDDPLRIGEILPDRVAVRLVIGLRLDKIAVKEIEQVFVQQNLADWKEVTPAGPGLPNKLVVLPVPSHTNTRAWFVFLCRGGVIGQRLEG